jgi:two-component system response regulator AtoC
VRELENILERALIYGEGELIGAADIELHRAEGSVPHPSGEQGSAPSGADGPASGGSRPGEKPPRSLESWEKEAILDALERCNGNRTKAAEELGITRKTLLSKIKAYGIDLFPNS